MRRVERPRHGESEAASPRPRRKEPVTETPGISALSLGDPIPPLARRILQKSQNGITLALAWEFACVSKFPQEDLKMKLFAGLGNPGSKYAGTRHNIGFMAVDRLAEGHGFPPWRSKFSGQFTQGVLGGVKAGLLKPETYMNLSGRSVAEAARFYKIDPSDIVVFHDELDLAPGRVKVKAGGGHAGHNGLRSIHELVGPDYMKVRIGIGHPGHKDKVLGYVLGRFTESDAAWIEALLPAIGKSAGHLANGDAGGFLNQLGLLLQSSLPSAKKPPADRENPAKEPARSP